MTIKGQLAPIGVSQAGRPGHLIAVNLQGNDNASKLYTYAVGLSSSQNIVSTSASTAAAGVRVVRAYPTITKLSVPTNSGTDGTQKILYRFSVSAPAGTNGVSLYKFTFNIATSHVSDGTDNKVTNLRLYAFTDSNFSQGAYSADGQLNNGGLFSEAGNPAPGQRATTSDFAIYFNPANPTSADPEAILIPAGSTYYFQLRGDFNGFNQSGDSATVQLMGDNYWVGYGPGPDTVGEDVANDGFLFGNDARKYLWAAAAPDLNASTTFAGEGVTGTKGNVDDTHAGVDFLWSGNSTTTHSGAADDSGPDWYNGFLVPGLSTTGAGAETFTY
jgi:hypothetical protein